MIYVAAVAAVLAALKAGLAAKGFGMPGATLTVGSDGRLEIGLWAEDIAAVVFQGTLDEALAEARSWICNNRPNTDMEAF